MSRFFVGNLPWTIGRRELKEYFSQFGRVTNTTIPINKGSGFSKGFGFVTFQDGGVRSAVLDCQHVLEGSKITVVQQGARNDMPVEN